MTPLNVEFAPGRRAPGWLWAVFIIVMLLLGAQQGRQAWDLRTQVRAAERQGAAFATEIDEIKRKKVEATAKKFVERPYVQDALEVAAFSRFSLQSALRSIESARVLGVHVTALEASAVDGTVKIEVQVSVREALLQYLDELNAGEPQRKWLLLHAQTSAASGQGVATIACACRTVD